MIEENNIYLKSLNSEKSTMYKIEKDLQQTIILLRNKLDEVHNAKT